MQPNNFDEVLDIESGFYDSGFNEGLNDGIKAGRVEGRTFGLEKGFEKYLQNGRIEGKAIVWANRAPQLRQTSKIVPDRNGSLLPLQPQSQPHEHVVLPSGDLPSLPNDGRLLKHIRVLYALSESESLSTENSEEAVSDFDDRLNRALGKLKVIERKTGEAKPDV